MSLPSLPSFSWETSELWELWVSALPEVQTFKTEIPSVRFHLVLPKKKMSPPKQKYGDCVGGLYKYIIIDVSLSSKSSVISTSFEMSWTGGHPQLLRWFCRAARTSALDSTRIRTSGRLVGCDGFRKKTCKGQQCATVQWLARLFKYCVCIYEWYRYRDYRVVCAIHNICNHLHIYVAYLRHGDSSRVPKKLCCEVSFAMSDTHFESKKHWKGWLPLLPTLWFHWSILIRAQEVNICHGTCMAQSSLSKQMYGDIWGTYGYGTSYFHQVFSHISSPPNSWFLNASKMRLESSCFTTAACKSFSSSDWLALEHLNGCELSGMDDSVALTLLTYSDWFPFDIYTHTMTRKLGQWFRCRSTHRQGSELVDSSPEQTQLHLKLPIHCPPVFCHPERRICRNSCSNSEIHPSPRSF